MPIEHKHDEGDEQAIGLLLRLAYGCPRSDDRAFWIILSAADRLKGEMDPRSVTRGLFWFWRCADAK